MIFLHQAYINLTYNFVFNHDHKFWFILIIKNVIKSQYRIITKFKKEFWMVQHMWPFLWSILEPTTNLKTFGGGLNNKKHI
jgi:hypothetical protein